MGLVDVQKALARLYTNGALRERFFADPVAVARELGFSDDEARRLAELSPARVAAFASALHNKRLNHIAKLLPLSKRVLGVRFTEAFRLFAEDYVPAGTKKHLGDALAFAEHLERLLRAKGYEPRWALDLLRYEKARLKAADPRRRMVVCVFRHDISQLVRSLARQGDAAVFTRPCVAVWARMRRGTTVRYAVFMVPALRRKK